MIDFPKLAASSNDMPNPSQRQATLDGKNWRAAAWVLECRFPEEYAKSSKNSCKCGSDGGQETPPLSIVS